MKNRGRKPVQLSHIKRIEYDALQKMLEIEFQRGGAHLYYGVPEEIFQKFSACESKWAFFLSHIRKAYRSMPKR